MLGRPGRGAARDHRGDHVRRTARSPPSTPTYVDGATGCSHEIDALGSRVRRDVAARARGAAAGPCARARPRPAPRARPGARAGRPLTYDDPLHVVRGEGAWLIDADGRALPRRLQQRAGRRPLPPAGRPRRSAAQLATLNTNTRYLHEAPSRSPSGCWRRCRRPGSTACCSSTPAARRTTSPADRALTPPAAAARW